MQNLRRLLLGNRAFAAMLVAMALLVRVMVPAGTMPQARSLSVSICADSIGRTLIRSITIPAKADQQGSAQHHDGVCAFASLGMGAAGGDDLPDLPASPLAVVAHYVLPPATAPPAAAPYLLPPLRGPPAQA